MFMSKAEKYNECNPRDDSYCLFEERAKRLESLLDIFTNPNNFVEWQKKCVCDFESNENTHSKTCLSRFEKILENTIDLVESS